MCRGGWIHFSLILSRTLNSNIRFISDRKYIQIANNNKTMKIIFFQCGYPHLVEPSPSPPVRNCLVSAFLPLSLVADILYGWALRRKRKLDCLLFQWKNTRKFFFKISILQLNNPSLIANVIWNWFLLSFGLIFRLLKPANFFIVRDISEKRTNKKIGSNVFERRSLSKY